MNHRHVITQAFSILLMILGGEGSIFNTSSLVLKLQSYIVGPEIIKILKFDIITVSVNARIHFLNILSHHCLLFKASSYLIKSKFLIFLF